MKQKLREYIDLVFADAEKRAPGNQRVADLKEEILQNLYEKYDDLIANGKSPAAAYNAAVAGVGDISGLLDAVSGGGSDSRPETVSRDSGGGSGQTREEPPKRPRFLTAEEREAEQKYRKKAAVLRSVATALYILCWVPLVVLGVVLDDVGGAIGLALMFLMIAGATAMNVYRNASRPDFVEDPDKRGDDGDGDDDGDDDDNHDADGGSRKGRPRRSPVYGAVSGALWALTLCAYLLVSFLTGAWYITWMIFLIAATVDNIIKAIFDLRR